MNLKKEKKVSMRLFQTLLVLVLAYWKLPFSPVPFLLFPRELESPQFRSVFFFPLRSVSLLSRGSFKTLNIVMAQFYSSTSHIWCLVL